MRQCMDVVRTEKPLPRELTMTVVPEVSTAFYLVIIIEIMVNVDQSEFKKYLNCLNFHYVLEVSHGRSNMKFTFNLSFLSEPEITPVGICQKKEERGPCSDFEVKWFYNTTSQRCDRFWYGGCEGNDNRFDDEEACSRRCKQTTPDTGIKWLCTKFDGSFEIISICLNDLSTFENQ